MTRLGVELVDPSVPLPTMARIAGAAAAAGYRTVWTNEVPGRDAFVTLSAWGREAPRARLGIGVAPLYVRPPVTAAGAAALMAAHHPGGFVLGIGAGHPQSGRASFGFSFRSPLGAVAEYAEIARRLLAGDTVTFHGAAYRIEGTALPEPASVPVVVGAMGPRMLAAAAAAADGVLINWTTAAELRRIGTEARERAGRPFEVAAQVRVATGRDRAAAREALARDFVGYLRLPAYGAHLDRQGFPAVAAAVRKAWDAGGRAAAAAAIPDDVLGEFGIYGTPGECREGLAVYGAAELDELVVRPVPVGDGGPWPAAAACAPSGLIEDATWEDT